MRGKILSLAFGAKTLVVRINIPNKLWKPKRKAHMWPLR